MSTVTAGIIGLGYWGPNLLRNFAATPGCRVKYACDLSEKNVEKLRGFYPAVTFTQQAQDIFGDAEVDLVVIATPTTAHFPLAKAALEADKNVFVEKPMTASVKEADELLALAKKQGKQIFVDHPFVFAPAVERMGQWVKEGKLGELLYFDSTRINLGLIQKDTNVLWDLAVHDLSMLGALADLSTITKVDAQGSAHFGTQVEHAHLHLEFQSGFHAHITVSWLSPVKIRHTILSGKKAMVTYDDTEPSEKLRLYDRGVDHDDTKADPFFPKYRAGDVIIPALANTETLAIQTRHVVACINGTEQARVPGSTGREVVRILELADEALKRA